VSPYRERVERRAPAEEPKAGFVSDMVRQFADPYAFLRELVQNSMDAGSPSVEVDIIHESEGETRTRVSDTGSGMTPDVIEGALLTLFSSSKEGDTSKIGKYGVGFISVLALSPDVVVVDTWRDGGAWRATIARDHSYVLEELPPRSGSGTSVSLLLHRSGAELEQHVAKVREALVRWCRHARVPIWLSHTDYENPQTSFRTRVDAPLAIHAPVAISDLEGEDTIVLGPGDGADLLPLPNDLPEHENRTPFLGLYNRGLTLYESSSERLPGLERMRVKISSPRLKHTLTRDNVRREGDFDELIARAQKLAARALPRALSDALRASALALHQGEDPKAYLAVAQAARAGAVELEPDALWFPLADPIDRYGAATLATIQKRTPWRAPVLTVAERDALSQAFAEQGRPVVLAAHADIVRHLASRLGESKRCESIHEHHLLVSELGTADLTSSDRALLDELSRVLAVAGAPVERVTLARALGARADRLVLCRELTHGIVHVDDAARAAQRWGSGSVLYLDTRREAVRAARDAAGKKSRAAAHLLARLLLLERSGPLKPKQNDALLADYARGPA